MQTQAVSSNRAITALPSEFATVACAARAEWRSLARWNQLPPAGDWTNWLLLAGRGFGKTRVACEDAWWYAARNPGVRVAMAARTQSDVRKVVFEGESGLIACCPRELVDDYSRTEIMVTLKNGSILQGGSAEKPDGWRGPQWNRAYLDELTAWKNMQETYANIMMGLRLGTDTRCIISTTPRPVELLMELYESADTVVSHGSTYANRANLAEKFFRSVIKRYEGTSKGEQELQGRILSEAEGALWSRQLIDTTRRPAMSPQEAAMRMVRIVVAVDPTVTATAASDECGIVVVGVDAGAHGYVLEDASAQMAPDVWAKTAIKLYRKWNADRVVAEVNQGGDLVEMTLRTVDQNVPYKGVYAHEGKRARAEPVSALFEQNRSHLCGAFDKLERQLCAWVPTTGDKSPDRLDAMVWGLTDTCLTPAFYAS